jgi:Ca2+-binding RTX toxin-like protein
MSNKTFKMIAAAATFSLLSLGAASAPANAALPSLCGDSASNSVGVTKIVEKTAGKVSKVTYNGTNNADYFYINVAAEATPVLNVNALGGNDKICLYSSKLYTKYTAITLDGGSGNDDITAEDPNNQTLANGVYIFGQDGNDTIQGTHFKDTIRMGKGDDFVIAGAGDDFLDAYDGNDFVFGDDGNDTIFGGKGDDLLYGGLGDDTIFGDVGNDTLSGGNSEFPNTNKDGKDVLQGDAGKDEFRVLTQKIDVIKDFNKAYDTKTK